MKDHFTKEKIQYNAPVWACILFILFLFFLPTGYQEIYREADQCVAKVLETDDSAIIDTGLVRSGEQRCKLEIISGHHRVKSARAAEMKEIIAIVDVSGLSRSKIAAKQLAHNAISGFDDDSTLREIVKMIDDVDDMIESFVGKEIMEEPLEQYDKMLSPAVQFDFKNVTFTFLPHQVNDMDILVKDLESKAPEIVGVASYEQCKAFVETLSKYQKFTDIRNVGAAIHSMIENANEKMDAVGFDAEEEWTYLAKVFGSNAIPADAAEVIKQAIKKAEKEGTITSKNRWQLIEYLCADYLGK